MLTLLSFNDEYSVGTQLRDLFIIDVNSIGTEEVRERLSPLLEDRYLDKVVCYQLIFYLYLTYNLMYLYTNSGVLKFLFLLHLNLKQ